MYIICSEYDQAVLCYSTGERQTYVNKELAMDKAVAISANNPGMWFVTGAFDSRVQYWARAIVKHKNPLKVRGISLLNRE
jgi:hypothetical protein